MRGTDTLFAGTGAQDFLAYESHLHDMQPERHPGGNSGEAIALLCEFVEELEGAEPEWLNFIRHPGYVIEYSFDGEPSMCSPAEAAACLRRLRGLAVQHGKQWTSDSRWPQYYWDAEELVEWLDWTIETVENQPIESRIYALEQHG